MNNIKSFTIYDNCYKLIKLLDEESKKIISLSIFEYMFEDKEPKVLSESGSFVWDNLKMILDNSKKQALNGAKGGRPKSEEKPNEKPKRKPNQKAKPKPKKKPNEKPKRKANNISNFLFIISNFKYLEDRGLLRGKIEEWLNYKIERNETYTETGFKTLLKKIEQHCEKYSEDDLVNLIDDCMASNYKGIIFEKLENKKVVKKPTWFEKDIKKEETTPEEIEAFKKTLEEIRNE